MLSKKIIDFYKNLSLDGIELPPGIRAMNPYSGLQNASIMKSVTDFFTKFYADTSERKMILGINPGRIGGGSTGIMFTDTIRLTEKCKISFEGPRSYEPSSEFFYKVIDIFGGVEKFYKTFYVGAVSPLGFVTSGKNNKEVNYNFYDSAPLKKAVTPFIIDSIKKQIQFNISREVCYCLGTGKNYKFLNEINKKHQFFNAIIPLEHPRFIMQYRRKRIEEYIEFYLQKFRTSNITL